MNQHLGPTYLFSVMLVVASAVAFYRADRPSLPPGAQARLSSPGAAEPRNLSAATGPAEPRAPFPPRSDGPRSVRNPTLIDGGPTTDVGLHSGPYEDRRTQKETALIRPEPDGKLAERRPANATVAARRASNPGIDPIRNPTPAARLTSRVDETPHAGFTRIEPGETLADVSLRLYGSPARSADLWRANRDQLATPQSPLEAGMVLRTP